MVESTITQYLADKLGMTLGEDIFVNALPEGVEYGVWVRNLSEEYQFGSLTDTTIGIFVSYNDYYTTREKALSVKDAIVAMKGCGDWASGGTATISNLGVNSAGDHMISVVANIFNGG